MNDTSQQNPEVLTEREKGKIRAEETFRFELHKQLKAKTNSGRSKRERVWSVLNSSFILWILSSVVLSSLTAGYTFYSNRRAKAEERSKLEYRLNTEISYRIYPPASD